MKVKAIVDEDFVNYKKPSMFIGTAICDWKCCKEVGVGNSMCQNSVLARQKNIEISVDEIFHRYTSNPITQSIVFAGLEPMLQFDDVLEVIKHFRNNRNNDDIVIYTGYYDNEIPEQIKQLQHFTNIIIKFGRYLHKNQSKYDELLGVTLASSNQYGEKIC